MLIYRISKSEFANDLSGTGAGLYGGRWNPKGFNMVYGAESISLASLEYLAHNFHLISTMEITLSIIAVPDDSTIMELKQTDLPENWNTKISSFHTTQEMGVRFLQQSKSYLLKVPSAIIPLEFNLLLNPSHELHSKTKIIDQITPFKLDARLLGISNS